MTAPNITQRLNTKNPNTSATHRAIAPQELIANQHKKFCWAVKGVIPEGLMCLSGAPKIGKSWMMLSLAIEIARGNRVFGMFDTEPGTVLYLALEDNKRRLKDRYDKLIAHTSGIDLRQNLHWPIDEEVEYFNSPVPSLSDKLAKLGAWHDLHPKARIIIIDTIRRFAPGQAIRGLDAYQKEYAQAIQLQQFAISRQIAVLVVHHTKKGEKIEADTFDKASGSRGLRAAVDCEAILALENQNTAKFSIQGKDVEAQEYGFARDSNSGLWVCLGDAELTLCSEARQEIINCLQGADKPLTPKKIAEQIGAKPENVRNSLRKMKIDRQVVSDGKGGYSILPDASKVFAPYVPT